MRHASTPQVLLKLPEPFSKGVDLTKVTEAEIKVCIQEVENDFPWMRTCYSVEKARCDAKKFPGTTFLYDVYNGFWRSSIYNLFQDFLHYERTGVDRRAERKRNHKNSSNVSGSKQMKLFSANVGLPVAAAVPVAVSMPQFSFSEDKELVSPKRSKELYKPPNAVFQQARYAGFCLPLRKYLKQNKLWSQASKAHWKAISVWTKTTEGRNYIRDAGLDPEDHIHDKNKTPVWHAFNCFFMASSVNSHFGDRTDKEKMTYVGETAEQVSSAFVKFYIEEATKLQVDCAKFNPAVALMK